MEGIEAAAIRKGAAAIWSRFNFLMFWGVLYEVCSAWVVALMSLVASKRSRPGVLVLYVLYTRLLIMGNISPGTFFWLNITIGVAISDGIDSMNSYQSHWRCDPGSKYKQLSKLSSIAIADSIDDYLYYRYYRR